MRSAIGNSLLMSLVVIIVSLVMLVFVGILSYSKAYRVKNRIIEVIEKYGSFEYEQDGKQIAKEEIKNYLHQVGYQVGKCPKPGFEREDSLGYKYCVLRTDLDDGSKYYTVTTYVEYNFPIINQIMTTPVTGETRILGKNYDDYD